MKEKMRKIGLDKKLSPNEDRSTNPGEEEDKKRCVTGFKKRAISIDVYGHFPPISRNGSTPSLASTLRNLD
jgi:hypothetical protein